MWSPFVPGRTFDRHLSDERKLPVADSKTGLPAASWSGFNQQQEIASLETGTPFLPKPFTLEDLATKARETIDQKPR
jgi:hypothetical protein